MALGFFDAKMTPDQLATRRQELDYLASRIGGATNVGSGIGDIFKGLAVGLGRRNANKIDQQNTDTGNSAWDAFMGSLNKPSTAPAAPSTVSSATAPQNAPVAPSMGTGMQGFGKGQTGTMVAQRLQKDFGLSPAAAAGFAGNLAHESGNFKIMQEINPTVPGSKGGLGWAQWTGPRRRAFEAYAAQNGLDPASPEANYGFMTSELKGPEAGVLKRLQGVNDPAQAAQIVSQFYERPGTPHMNSRIQYANQIAQGLGAPQPTQVASNDPQQAFNVQPASLPPQAPPQAQQTAQAAPQSPMQEQPQQGNNRLQELINLAGNPYISNERRQIVHQMLQQEMQNQDPLRKIQMQAAQQGLDKGALEISQMQNPPPPKPIEVGGRLLDPTTFKPVYEPPPKPADPFTLQPGDVRFDGSGKQIASGGEKPPTVPSAVQEYQFATTQGFKGTFQDWEASKKGGMQFQVDPTTGAVTFQQGGNIKPMTEAQSKDVGYATRAKGALQNLKGIDTALTETVGNTLGQIPIVGNFAKSNNYQKAEQASKEFMLALLRKDSGGAITPDEFTTYGGVYLPKMGDTPDVIAQKRAARERALSAIEAGMPPQAILAQERALAQSAPQTQAQPVQQQSPQIPYSHGNIPSGAIQDLMADPSPESQAQFDEIFGPGAARKALGK